MRFYEIEYHRKESPFQGDPSLWEPSAAHQAAPRDHSPDPKPSKLGWYGMKLKSTRTLMNVRKCKSYGRFGTILLVIVGIVVIGGVLGFGMHFFQQRSLHQRKRFY